jgi:hypothetical protein
MAADLFSTLSGRPLQRQEPSPRKCLRARYMRQLSRQGTCESTDLVRSEDKAATLHVAANEVVPSYM